MLTADPWLGGLQFSYPWLLTTIHAGSATIGCYALLYRGSFSLSGLTFRQEMVLIAFSVLFTVNIAISNVSLYVALTGILPCVHVCTMTDAKDFVPAFAVLWCRFRSTRS